MAAVATKTEPSHADSIPLADEKQSPSPSDNSSSTTSTPDFSKAPDGGTQAWLVATGASLVFFSGLGFANAFGVFQQYYMTHQLRGDSPDKIAWIGSLSAFLQFAGGAVGGPLFDRAGASIIRPAAAVYVFSVMMLSLCDKYWQFMLTQGVLMGLSMGFMMFPAMAAVSQYFNKHRAAALGLAVAGSSIGGVVIPIVFSKMLNSSSLGFGWSVRIVGFGILPLLAFSCVVIKARLPPRPTTFFIAAAFKQPPFVLLVASMFCMFCGMFTPLFYIPAYAVSRGINVTMASYLLAIVNASSTFGRIVPGILADKFGRLNALAIGGTATGVVIFCLNEAKTTAGLVVYSMAIGFASGTIISGASAAFSVCTKETRNLGTYMGMGMAVSSIAVLIGPPVNGALLDEYGFWEVSIFSGVMCLAGGFIAFACKAVTPEGLFGKV